ncbi:MAG: tyrosine-type recombinase/integrase [Verrucomicrobia bacterium]|nr:tyrosine-type recombinase/integrase [Verrucomicrobiota bacterium]
MVAAPSRKPPRWPRKIRVGRVSVTVYRRQTPSGNVAFMVANYSAGKRRFDSYRTETEAIESAHRLARDLNERGALAAAMTGEQAADCAAAIQALAPFNVALPAAAATLASCLKLVGDLPNLHAAAKFYSARYKATVRKCVADVVTELLAIKQTRGASMRYLQDLRFRLGRFAGAFSTDACSVTTADIQTWLDAQKVAPQTYTNFRRVLHVLFQFAVARGYASDNPVVGVEQVKVSGGDVAVFTPSEIARLLAVASPEFVPCLAIGAFAGLRSAEIERLEWSDIDLAGRHIIVGATKAKTASRRVVPISENLIAWLAPYAGREGRVWGRRHDDFYKAEQETAASTAVKADPIRGIRALTPVRWKSNALRHSYASYRFALTGDAGRVAGEMGNTAAVVHKHYRELVKPADAERWFAIKPKEPANVMPMAAAGTN